MLESWEERWVENRDSYQLRKSVHKVRQVTHSAENEALQKVIPTHVIWFHPGFCQWDTSHEVKTLQTKLFIREKASHDDFKVSARLMGN